MKDDKAAKAGSRCEEQEPGQYTSGQQADEESAGSIRIHHDVIALIARNATLRVPGVVGMSGSFADGLASFMGKDVPNRGVRIEDDGESLTLNIYVIIEYGVRIPQVAMSVQAQIRAAVEEITGRRVGKVNVIVQGLCMPDQNEKKGEMT